MRNEIKQILLITPGFAANEEDSSCIPALQDYVRGLNTYAPQLDVTVISMHYPALSKTYNWFHNEVHAIGADNCKFPRRLVYWRKMKQLIVNLHAQKNFDLVHAFWYDEVTFVASKVVNKLNIPLFCTFMGQDALANNRYCNRIKLPVGKLIAISAFQKEHIRVNFGYEIEHIIPWGLVQPMQRAPEKSIDIINVGSFNSVKNQHEALEIIQEITAFKLDIKCIFVGAGEYLESVKAVSDNYGLKENVQFLGNLDRMQTLNLISQSKILLHCSDYESYGMIFAEAASLGTMIVSKKVGIAKDEEWWKLYSEIPQAVMQINQLLTNPNYPNEAVSKEFSIEKTVDQYLTFWRTKKGRT